MIAYFIPSQANELIEFDQPLTYKDKNTNIQLLSIFVDDEYIYLNVDIKTKLTFGTNFVIKAYDESHKYLYTRVCIDYKYGYTHRNNIWAPDGSSKYSATYRQQVRQQVSFIFSKTLYSDAKYISVIHYDVKAPLFDMIPVNINNVKPEIPDMTEEHIKQLIDIANDPICGIYQIGDFNLACLKEGYNYKFRNMGIDNTDIWEVGDIRAELFPYVNGKAYKGYWMSYYKGLSTNTFYLH